MERNPQKLPVVFRTWQEMYDYATRGCGKERISLDDNVQLAWQDTPSSPTVVYTLGYIKKRIIAQ